VEQGPSGEIVQPVDPRFITSPTIPQGTGLFGDSPFPSESDRIFGFARDIDGRISGELLGRDPFPQELVPPFNVQPGLAQDGNLFNSIFGSGQGFDRASAGIANVDLNQFDPTTREVQREELVSEQLNDLLDADGAFIQNAVQRGREAAQDRGALSSSMFAGSSQRAAIEAGLPIASADAQAFITAASQNMAAVNQNTLAKMQSATQMAISNAQNITQASATNAQVSGRQNEARIQFETNRILADSRERIASTQLNAQYAMQQGQFVQQQVMESLQQQGRIDLTRLGGNIQAELQRRGIQGQIDISNLNQAQRIEMEELFGQPRFEAQFQFGLAQLQGQMQANVMNNWASGVASMNGLDLDDAARSRGQQFWNDFYENGMRITEEATNPANWDNSFDFSDFGN